LTNQAQVELITLDLDDTLWPCLPAIIEAEAAVYAWLQQRCPGLTRAHDIESLREHRREVRQRWADIAHDITAVRVASLTELLQESGCPGRRGGRHLP
jgi:FMN hydrolase / 5-amino-6-(5-phospho-D-ribitylamino)uracil phosphatase